MNYHSAGSSGIFSFNKDKIMLSYSDYLNQIKELVAGKSIAITTHTGPDPDAIGSCLGIQWLVLKLGAISADVFFAGTVSDYQNKTIINILNVNYKAIDRLSSALKKEKSEYDITILVDTAVTGEKNLPQISFDPSIIIDHHDEIPKSKPQIEIIQPIGSCSTIITKLIFELSDKSFSSDNLEDQIVATALMFGIKTDTQDLSSNNTKDLDRQMYAEISKFIDADKANKINNYDIPEQIFELEVKAYQNRRKKGTVLVAGLGYLEPEYRDALPYIANRLLRMKGVETVVTFAIINGLLDVSVRSLSPALNIQELCYNVFGEKYSGAKKEGKAGGAKVPLGFYELSDVKSLDIAKDLLWKATEEIMVQKIFKITAAE